MIACSPGGQVESGLGSRLDVVSWWQLCGKRRQKEADGVKRLVVCVCGSTSVGINMHLFGWLAVWDDWK